MAATSEPGISEVQQSQDRQSSREFAEQIRQLEEEGSQLLEATYALSESLPVPTSTHLLQTPSSLTHRALPGGPSSSQSLTALTDIAAEQKTIDKLRQQLDAQSRETERLQRSLAEPGLGLSRYPSTPNLSSSLSALNLPSLGSGSEFSGGGGGQRLGVSAHTLGGGGGGSSSSSHNMALSNGSSYSSYRTLDHTLQLHGEKQLAESQQEMASLRARLREALQLCDEQKQSFRLSQEELRRQLAAAIASRDSVLDLKNRESSTQEALIVRLQATIDRLEDTNRSQEETLLELTSRLDSSQKDQLGTDTVLTQLRHLVSECQTRSGRSYYDTESVSRQSPAALVHSLERCLADLEADSNDKQLRLQQLTSEFESMKRSGMDRQQSTNKQHQDRLTELAEAHDKELSEVVERFLQSRKQVTTLQEQLSILQQQSEQEANQKNEQIRELENALETARQRQEKSEGTWCDRREALESALDSSQRELALLRKENTDSIYTRAKSESKLDSLQETITQLEAELNLQKDLVQKASQDGESTREKLESVTQKFNSSEQEVEHLKNLLHLSKHESDTHLQNAVVSLERQEKERSAEQLSAVSQRLTDMTDRFHTLTLEHEVLKAEHRNLKERHHQVASDQEETQRRLETANTARENLNVTLQDRVADIGHLTQDRDYYRKLSEEKSKEASELQVEVDKLAVQLEERQKNVEWLTSQNNRINDLFDSTSTKTRSLREEQDQLLEQLNVCVTERDHLRSIQENLTKKMKIREKHIVSLEDDNKQMAEVLAVNKDELEELVKEKEKLFNELKDSRYEVSSLSEDSHSLRAQLDSKEKQYKKEVHKLSGKLKAAEQDLKTLQKALRTHEQVDGKAVIVAGKMQREVTEKRGQIDTLQSKVRWLEECLENTAKEKKILKEESERLATSLKKLVRQNERLTAELGAMTAQSTELQARSSTLESALEKAAVKYAAVQAQLEQCEQDIARMKLKHQLELKELERTGHRMTSQVSPLVTMETSKAHVPLGSTYGTSSLPVTMATTRQSLRLAGRSGGSEPEVPVSQKSGQEQVENFAATNGVGQELRAMLDEMRSLITSGHEQQLQQQQHQQQPQQLVQQATLGSTILGSSHQGLFIPHQFSDGNNPATFDSEYPSKSRSTKGKSTRSKVKDNKMKTTGSSRKVITSTAVKRKSPHKVTPESDVSARSSPVSVSARSSPASVSERFSPTSVSARSSPASMASRMCTSPVSGLLVDKYKYDHRFDTESFLTTGTLESDLLFDTKPNLCRPGMTFDTEALCRRLGKKIEKLSRMGTNLQAENKEMANLMKSQDARLKKVRTSEKLLRS